MSYSSSDNFIISNDMQAIEGWDMGGWRGFRVHLIRRDGTAVFYNTSAISEH